MAITVTRTIEAPVERVFDTIAHIDNYSKAIPHIVKVEILSDVKSGVGTRFRETRTMRGREATTELEVTEYVENDRIRVVSDTGGTVWDSMFMVKPAQKGTDLTLVMDARPRRLVARIMTPMIMGVVKKAVEDDMDAVKNYCEKE